MSEFGTYKKSQSLNMARHLIHYFLPPLLALYPLICHLGDAFTERCGSCDNHLSRTSSGPGTGLRPLLSRNSRSSRGDWTEPSAEQGAVEALGVCLGQRDDVSFPHMQRRGTSRTEGLRALAAETQNEDQNAPQFCRVFMSWRNQWGQKGSEFFLAS